MSTKTNKSDTAITVLSRHAVSSSASSGVDNQVSLRAQSSRSDVRLDRPVLDQGRLDVASVYHGAFPTTTYHNTKKQMMFRNTIRRLPVGDY